MTQIDIVLVWCSLVCAAIFLILWTSKLIKFYIGTLIGLLLCILINLKLGQIGNSGFSGSLLDNFFWNNRDFLWSISLLVIPLMGILFLLNKTFIIQEENWWSWLGSLIWKFLMGLALFPLILGMYSTLHSLWLSTNSFLGWLIDWLKRSNLLQLISEYWQYIFFLLLVILLYKFVFKFLFFILITWIKKIRELRAEEREIRRRKRYWESQDSEEDEVDNNEH